MGTGESFADHAMSQRRLMNPPGYLASAHLRWIEVSSRCVVMRRWSSEDASAIASSNGSLQACRAVRAELNGDQRAFDTSATSRTRSI